ERSRRRLAVAIRERPRRVDPSRGLGRTRRRCEGLVQEARQTLELSLRYGGERRVMLARGVVLAARDIATFCCEAPATVLVVGEAGAARHRRHRPPALAGRRGRALEVALGGGGAGVSAASSRRSGGIGLPQTAQRPYSPRSSRARASSMSPRRASNIAWRATSSSLASVSLAASAGCWSTSAPSPPLSRSGIASRSR